MGLQHVGQANANQPYNSRPRKLEYNWMKIPEPQPHLSVSPSFFKCRRCLACRKIVLFCVTTQTNLEAAGGQCSAVGRAGCYQGLPDTSTAPGLTRSHQVSPGLWLPHPPSQTHSETLPYSPLFTTRSAENKYIFWFYRCGRRGIWGFPDVFIQN